MSKRKLYYKENINPLRKIARSNEENTIISEKNDSNKLGSSKSIQETQNTDFEIDVECTNIYPFNSVKSMYTMYKFKIQQNTFERQQVVLKEILLTLEDSIGYLEDNFIYLIINKEHSLEINWQMRQLQWIKCLNEVEIQRDNILSAINYIMKLNIHNFDIIKEDVWLKIKNKDSNESVNLKVIIIENHFHLVFELKHSNISLFIDFLLEFKFVKKIIHLFNQNTRAHLNFKFMNRNINEKIICEINHANKINKLQINSNEIIKKHKFLGFF